MTDAQKLDMIVKAVKDVRAKQKAYFKARKQSLPFTDKLLADSKASEKLLDEMADSFGAPENTQQSIFDN